MSVQRFGAVDVMTPRLERRLKIIAKLGITAVILYLVFTLVPFAEVVRSIRMAHLPHLVLAALIVLVGPYLSARRLKILTDAQGMSVSVRQIVHINFVSNFYGLALPGQLAGGAVRWHRLWLLERKNAEVLAAILYGRIILIIVLCLMGMVFLVADLPRGVHRGSIVSLLVLLVFLVVLTWIGTRADRLRWLRRKASDEDGFARRLASAAGLYRRLPRRRLGSAFAVATGENLAGVVVVLLLAASLEIHASWITLGWIRSVVQAVTALPLSISGLGIREGGMLLLLEPYGVSGAQAVALSFLMLGRTLLLGAVGGLLEAWDSLISKPTTRRDR
jgi:uncharacterized protein (TIRG00374 family)